MFFPVSISRSKTLSPCALQFAILCVFSCSSSLLFLPLAAQPCEPFSKIVASTDGVVNSNLSHFVLASAINGYPVRNIVALLAWSTSRCSLFLPVRQCACIAHWARRTANHFREKFHFVLFRTVDHFRDNVPKANVNRNIVHI